MLRWLFFAVSAGFGIGFVRRLQLRTAEGTEEQRMVDERGLFLRLADEYRRSGK